MPFYNVHYPDGSIKRHEAYYHDSLPCLGKVFYNRLDPYGGLQYFEVTEMGEEDIWVESITFKEYADNISKGVLAYYAFFAADYNSQLFES